MFALASLMDQYCGSHHDYSSYSVTLTLAFRRSSLAEIYTSIVLAIKAGEGLNTQDRALRVMVVNDCLFEDWMATCHRPRIPGHSPFAVEHASIPFAFEARERPSTQDKAGRPVAAIGHCHEDMMATYHPPGIAEEVDGKSSAIYSVPSDSFEGIRGETSSAQPQQCVHDDPDIPWHPRFFRGWRTGLLRQRGRDPLGVRTLKTKLGVSLRFLATSSST